MSARTDLELVQYEYYYYWRNRNKAVVTLCATAAVPSKLIVYLRIAGRPCYMYVRDTKENRKKFQTLAEYGQAQVSNDDLAVAPDLSLIV